MPVLRSFAELFLIVICSNVELIMKMMKINYRHSKQLMRNYCDTDDVLCKAEGWWLLSVLVLRRDILDAGRMLSPK